MLASAVRREPNASVPRSSTPPLGGRFIGLVFEADDAVVPAGAAVHDACPVGCGVDEQEEVVPDQLELVDGLVDNAASVVVVPSYYESFGMVALEAMASGTPVIASDVGGLSLNVVDGFNGYLVPLGDVDELAYRLGLLLTQDALRRQLGSQACRWAQRFSWQNIADETLAVYAQALGRPADDFRPLMAAPAAEAWHFQERTCP